MTALGAAGNTDQFVQFVGTSLSAGLLVIGLLHLVLGIVGCCGARNGQRVLLLIYIGALVVIMILELAVAGVVYTRRDEVRFMTSFSIH